MNKLKEYILEVFISCCNYLPFNNNNISNMIRVYHICLPLTSIIPCLILPIHYIFIIHIYLAFTVISQLMFKTCLLTDLEEHYYTGDDKYTSVAASILLYFDIEPTSKNKYILTRIITMSIVTIVIGITYYRYNIF